jgi:prevent-host-death family protein
VLFIYGHFRKDGGMITVGIRELKQQASELIRVARETGSEIQVTYHGTVVALLVPVAPAKNKASDNRAWASLDTLAAEIGARWPKSITAAQAVSEGRR